MFSEIQHAFASALLDPAQQVPVAVTSHNAAVPEKRFAVYRNNIVTSLIDALKTRFPAVERIVGDEFFAAMARVFVTEHPPHSPVLMTYGDDFPGFITGFPPAEDLPYLADVARLEAARTRAYHAADAVPIDPSRLQALAPDALASMRVGLHPSAEIIRSEHPIVTIWAMNAGEAELAPIEDWQREDALVIRPQRDVEVHLLPPGGAIFLQALADGAPLATAVDIAVAADPRFDLTANLALLIGAGLVVALDPSDLAQDDDG
jgi:hypothetical protein